MSFPEKEPVITAGAIVSLVTAVLALVVAFGAPLTPEQREGIIGVVAAVAPFALALVVRPNVTPNSEVETRVQHAVSDAVMNMGSAAGPAPH